MKQSHTKTLAIDITLDSSEMVMFNQGGKHSLRLKTKFSCYDEDNENFNFNDYDEVILSVQMEKEQSYRFNFINDEAKKHRAKWDEINKEEAAKQRPSEACPTACEKPADSQ